jgi:hypothetical protein
MTVSKQYSLALVAIALAAALVFGLAGAAFADMRTANATLSGSQEVPAVSATTTGSMTLSYDWSSSTSSSASTSNMQYSLSAVGSGITMAHLHCAPTGVNGPVTVTLFDAPDTVVTNPATTTVATSTSSSTSTPSATSTPTTSTTTVPGHVQISGVLASGTITNASVMSADCQSKIGYNIANIHDLARAIGEGKIYANVHTVQYPAGAARGQLMLSTPTTTPTTPTTTPPVVTPTTTPPVVTPTTTPQMTDHIQLLRELRNLLQQIVMLLQGFDPRMHPGWDGQHFFHSESSSSGASAEAGNGNARASAGSSNTSTTGTY